MRVSLHQEYTPANSWIRTIDILTSTKWKKEIKMNGYDVNLRDIPGKFQDDTQ